MNMLEHACPPLLQHRREPPRADEACSTRAQQRDGGALRDEPRRHRYRPLRRGLPARLQELPEAVQVRREQLAAARWQRHDCVLGMELQRAAQEGEQRRCHAPRTHRPAPLRRHARSPAQDQVLQQLPLPQRAAQLHRADWRPHGHRQGRQLRLRVRRRGRPCSRRTAGGEGGTHTSAGPAHACAPPAA